MESKLKNIHRILKHIPHPILTAVYLFALGSLFIVLDVIEPMLAGQIMDSVLSLQPKEYVLQLSLFWCMVFVFKYLIDYSKSKCGLKIMLYAMERMQISFFRKILAAPISFFEKYPTGYLMSRETDDIFNLEGMMIHHLVDGLLAMLEVVIIFILMLQINIGLGLGAMVLKMLDLFSNFYFPLKRLYKEHNEARAKSGSELQDILKNIVLIKTAGKENFESQRFETYLDQYYYTWNKRDWTNAIRSLLTHLAEDASYICIIALGGVFMYQGYLSVGEITAFLLFYRKLSGAFVGAIPLIPLFKIAEGAMERLDELVEEIPKVNITSDRERPSKVKKSIELQNIRFRYGDKWILDGVSMRFCPGDITAIVGKSGAGKSTIVQLLLGLRLMNDGVILWDGRNIGTFDWPAVRQMISYLPQDAFLFRRSLRENVLYESPKTVSERDIDNAMKHSAAEEICQRFLSQNIIMAESGKNLSGGEKQRISLARALLKNGQIFIFDEATSALDAETEKVIQQTIQDLSKEKIVIVIAHRLSTISQANKIYVLENGKIVEEGKHDSLMKEHGAYYRLFKEQVREDEKI